MTKAGSLTFNKEKNKVEVSCVGADGHLAAVENGSAALKYALRYS